MDTSAPHFTALGAPTTFWRLGVAHPMHQPRIGPVIPGFSGSEDCTALEQLLEGFDQQDQDQVSDVCNSPLFKYMDNDYAKLALSLAVPGGETKKKSPATLQEGVTGPAQGGSHVEEEDDEYSGGLC
ncbi:gamma-soluble NSF attachment [Pelobates cultripes]|uniref:Gamma-soluble NSF attachment n=1 Tax=Pelobates cultripes TaxID=61616 RepID=A0AAD1RXV7_PELCU|nr:gamma-soluble NSF attachment [Pelobates cultripes]